MIVRDREGRPLAGAHVSVEQESHDFQFGCVVPDMDRFSPDDRERFERRVAEVFNVVRRDSDESRASADVHRVDFRHTEERIHLAEVQRRLDRLSADDQPVGSTSGGLQVYASGRTVGLSAVDERAESVVGDERESARRVVAFYTLCFSHPAVAAIYWEGVCDREVGVGGGGLLRADLAPKHALKSLGKLVHSIWHSRASGPPDSLGEFRFRGFFGCYRVVVTASDGPPIVHSLDLQAAAGQNAVTIVAGR